MDNYLTCSLRRVLVMCGFAAANHHLMAQAQTIKDALPLLIADEECRRESELIISTLLDNYVLTSPDYDPISDLVSQLSKLTEKSQPVKETL
ncbi:DUF1039 domain-containing protein [Enterobacter cancerogenus]